MMPASPRPWASKLSTGLLILASPLLLAFGAAVAIGWPWDVGIGLAAVFSGRDVVQVADATETGVSLMLLGIELWALCWVLRLRLPSEIAWKVRLYGALLIVPMLVVLGLGAEYVLQEVLAARGYSYCTFHTISKDKGGHGTYVYVKNDLPDGCAATKAIFPAGVIVPNRRDPFDLPPASTAPASPGR